MCGVWASIGLPVAPAALAAVAHRGPDGEGLRTFETPAGLLTLGHRRLSIYDTSQAGAQPMAGAGDRHVVVFNGAIYNFLELRGELERLGHVFTTRSDTEVLLAAYAAWGAQCVRRFNGMFAFVLYDREKQKLLIARDRFGEKPLHTARIGNGLAFASEVGQVLAVAPDLARLNEARAGDFLNFGIVDAGEETFFTGIRRFPAAHLAVVDLCAGAVADITPTRFWSAPAVDSALARPEEAAAALASAMERAVRLRMAADVPVGTSLSGGLDSTWIARLAERSCKHAPPFVCVSAVFDTKDLSGASISERSFVDAALRGRRFDSRIIMPSDRDVADAFDRIVRAQGEPFASASICVQYLVFEEAGRAGLKVMLDGQGADELFGGYSGMMGPRLADIAMTLDFPGWRQEVKMFGAPGGDLGVRDLIRATYSAAMPERMRREISRLRGKWPPKAMLAPRVPPPAPVIDGPGARFDAVVRRLVERGSLPGLLRYEDRNSMAHGIETRLPFLDADVADLAFRMPGSVKLGAGETKRVVRLAAKAETPDVILRRRRKLGFVAPEDQWLGGALGPLAREAMDTARRDWSGLIDLSVLPAIEAGLGRDAQADAKAFRILSLVRWAKMHHVA